MPKIAYISTPKFRESSLALIEDTNRIVDEYSAQGYALTLRQVFYQLVSRGLIPNTQKSYKNLGNVISQGRLAGLIDWFAIEDRTRNLRGNQHWESPSQILRACASQFRYDLWEDQPNYVEVWVEKDALIGVIERGCRRLDVPYFSCRGYTSQSELWGAARRLILREQDGTDTHILHLGDHDPSGIDMTRDIQERLGLFGSRAKVTRIALTREQVDECGLPPNPAKLTDTRFDGYVALHGSESWELDALEPGVIVGLIERHVESLIDWEARKTWELRQDEARSYLARVAEKWEYIISGMEG